MPYRQPPPDAERCVDDGVPNEFGWGTRRCARRGNIIRDGKLYCRQHDPGARIEKQVARQAAWEAQWRSERDDLRIRDHRLATWDALLAALLAWVENYESDEAGFDIYLMGTTKAKIYAALAAAEKETTS